MKDIKNYEGLYAITEDGQVWSYKSNMFLKPYLGDRGYLKVQLWKDGKKKNCSVHRLVAEAFIPNPDNLETVNHKDENKTNNNVENLEWMDLADNIRYGTGIERSRKKVRKRIMCVETGEIFDSITIAANELHLYQGNISRVVDTDKTTGKMHFVSVKKEDK